MTLTHDHTIREFRSYLQQLGYGKSSVRMLPDCVKSFLDHNNITDIKGVSQEQIRAFYGWLRQRPHKRREGALSEQYINHHIYALRVFFGWLEQTGQIAANPISTMKFKSPVPNRREPFTQSELKALFHACETPQETALLHLFYSCGLRRTEAVRLNTRDIHFRQQILYVREGKGAKRRAVPMTVKVSEELEAYYLEARLPPGMERPQPKTNDQEAFMLNRAGTRMGGDSYNRRLKEIAARTDIGREVSLHYLRHSVATHLLENGLTVEHVRDFLGHRHLEATQIYVKVNQNQIGKL
ncbi:tyrosine-type recombinase/integrase [Lunatibacter salilacus]|uniref:tyrosine-type recombinase/integrase n=1 Tax=Lunatibacter salilacus TaxID=2483804 RepID=UPI00131CAE4B|nr:tyrosine-type recombinase/integrase [Lunatibacter salilacus]